MLKTIEVVQNDKGYDLNFTLKDADDAVIDISGATLLMNVQQETGTAIKFSGSMTIVSGTAGTCKYTPAATDFDTVGDHYAEIQITFSGGNKIMTIGDLMFRVKPELPRQI